MNYQRLGHEIIRTSYSQARSQPLSMFSIRALKASYPSTHTSTRPCVSQLNSQMDSLLAGSQSQGGTTAWVPCKYQSKRESLQFLYLQRFASLYWRKDLMLLLAYYCSYSLLQKSITIFWKTFMKDMLSQQYSCKKYE